MPAKAAPSLLVVAALCLAAGCGSSTRRTASTVSVATKIAGPRVVLLYRAGNSATQAVTPASLALTAAIIRKRVQGLRVPASVEVSGTRRITVILPSTGREDLTGPAVGSAAQLLFYDWEPNVIGPNGEPAPSESTVTGGAEAGSAVFGLTEYEAVLRAEKRKPELRKNDSTWDRRSHCTPEQRGGCLYGSWYLLDPKNESMLCPEGAKICLPADTERALYANGYIPREGSKPKAVRVNPGTVLIQARPLESASGKLIDASPNSWYVLKDDPVLTGSDITHPQQGFEETGANAPGSPNVVFGFTPHGKSVFERVTKEIAHRGQEAQLPGVSHDEAVQHFAVSLDGQLITTPSVDFSQYPEGIDATNGSQISGGFTVAFARELAEELQAGELPLRLTLVSRRGQGG